MINLRPNVLVETGRASYGDVIHQLPRTGGVRECIVARRNRIAMRDMFHATLLGLSLGEFYVLENAEQQVLASTDYGALELTTHGQSSLDLLGWSRLAEAINLGADVHCELAAQFLGVSITEFMLGYRGDLGPVTKKFYKSVRTAVKAANFGFPGGMGELKMVLQQRKQGPDTPCDNARGWIDDGKGNKIHGYKGLRFCVLLGAERCGVKKITEYKRKPNTPVCEACVRIAADIRTKWFARWPENAEIFKKTSDWAENGQVIVGPDGEPTRLKPAQVRQHRSMRLRGATDFCSASNGFFQGLAGDGAKLALTTVTRQCWDRTLNSPLWGCRVILFAHDELIVEGPLVTAHLWAPQISKTMIECMRVYTPDVAVTAPCAMATRWYKAMEPVYHAGRLVPWTPDHDPKTCEFASRGECKEHP